MVSPKSCLVGNMKTCRAYPHRQTTLPSRIKCLRQPLIPHLYSAKHRAIHSRVVKPIVRAFSQQEETNPGDRKRTMLINYVDKLTPQPNPPADYAAPVLAAMRQTVSNLIGTLPPQYFEVNISSRTEHVSQLLFTILMTGYMFHSAWMRLELTKISALSAVSDQEDNNNTKSALYDVGGNGNNASVDDVVSLSPSDPKNDANVSGDVTRWHAGKPYTVPAATYIKQLETELNMLRRQLVSLSSIADARAHGNELLDYLKGLTAPQLQELSSASPEVLSAMDALVQRLQGTDSNNTNPALTDCTAAELAQLLYWLITTGYELRTVEMQLDLQLTLSDSSRSLPA